LWPPYEGTGVESQPGLPMRVDEGGEMFDEILQAPEGAGGTVRWTL
jgi:hypothetical protein